MQQIVLTHGATCYSNFHKMKFENLVEICFWLNLAVKGLRNSFWQYRWIFPNWPPPNVKKNRRRVHCKELVQNISTYFQRQKLEWTANTTTVQAPPLLLVDHRLWLSLYILLRQISALACTVLKLKAKIYTDLEQTTHLTQKRSY